MPEETALQIPNVRLDDSALLDQILPELRVLVARGAFTLGAKVAEFERAAAAVFGCPWAVGTSSGTSALALALRASPLVAGSRVAVPANTFFATVEAVLQAGHVPVLIDHDEDHLLDLEQLSSVDVDAVIPVHLHGLPVDMQSLARLARQRGWWILEDAAQAHGASVAGKPVGSLGDAAAFSCYPTKNLGAWGDAGFVTGLSSEMADRLRALRHHGQVNSNEHAYVGGTERLDNLQALVLLAKLPQLSEEVARRRTVAAWYEEELAATSLRLPGDRADRTHVFHHYVISLPAGARDVCLSRLAERGIGGSVHYPTPVHRQPGIADAVQIGGELRRADSSGREVLSLPMFPSLARSEVARVGEALRDFLDETGVPAEERAV